MGTIRQTCLVCKKTIREIPADNVNGTEDSHGVHGPDHNGGACFDEYRRRYGYSPDPETEEGQALVRSTLDHLAAALADFDRLFVVEVSNEHAHRCPECGCYWQPCECDTPHEPVPCPTHELNAVPHLGVRL